MKQNSTNPFIRKVIYIALIGGLLIPLSFIARPEVTDQDGVVVDAGGRLSQMRRADKLAQASISQIDPTSEAMKLASLGLRGVAVNILWMQAMEHQKNEDFDKLAQTLQTLTKVQPNFIKVWEFQGHNLAFNVSMEFDDYEYRYEWVKKGLKFLKGGIAYNLDDHRMTDNLGFFTGTKFGKSDERLPFRRIFRKNAQFHNEMSDYIDPKSYDAREYGPDSYKMAWQWYNLSEEMVANGAQKFKSDLMFHQNRPSQTRQQAMILADEFRPDDVIRETWEDADGQWSKYGNIELRNSRNVVFRLEDTEKYDAEVADLRIKLDELTPGVREKKEREVWKSLGNSDEDFYVTQESPEQLNEVQKTRRFGFLGQLNSPKYFFDKGVAESATAENQRSAKRIADEIVRVLLKRSSISKDGGVINYSFWKSRNEAESTDAMIRARQAIHDADEMKRKSIFEDEYVIDYETGEKTIIRSGAAALYREAFAVWDDVLQEHTELLGSAVLDDLVDSIKDYRALLVFSGKDWPDDFSLQWLIDKRAERGERDDLPTSQSIAEMKADQEDSEEEAADEMAAEKKAAMEKEAEMKAAEEKAAMEKEAEMKAAEMKAAEMKAAEMKAAEMKEAEMKEKAAAEKAAQEEAVSDESDE